MINRSTRDEIVEIVNRLFVYTDARNWEKLQTEVFTTQVFFDMSSLGGPKEELSAAAICTMWENGFAGIDAVNHLAGNYLVEISGDTANVFAYATATHFKASATKGTTREFVGTYNLDLLKLETGWRICGFKYILKYMSGNTDLT